MKTYELFYYDEAPFGYEDTPQFVRNNDERDLMDGWEKWSLPLGNGYMGVNVFGGKHCEKLQITENSLCNPYVNNEGGLQSFALLYFDFPRYLQLPRRERLHFREDRKRTYKDCSRDWCNHKERPQTQILQ